MELERDVERYLVERLKQIGLTCVKFVPDQRPGMPDRVILLPGSAVIWVELKRGCGKLSELQRYRHAELRRIGHRVEVIWSKAEADQLVSEISGYGSER